MRIDALLHDRAAADQATQGGEWPQQRSRRWLLRGGDELFRSMYTRAKIAPHEVVAISSATAGEGRTTVALGIASTMAQDFPDRRIVVVETDLDQPVFARDFAFEAKPGLIDCLVADELIPHALRPTSFDNLRLIPSGGPARGTERLLGSSRMETLLRMMRRQFDVIVLDAPPILTDSDGAPVVALADACIFVVRAGIASADRVERAVAEIEPAKLRGTVLNGADSAVPRVLRRLFGLTSAGPR